MVETKVLAVCGGLVVVVAFGIYVCSWKLRRVRSDDQEVVPVAAVQHVRQSSKDLSEPLLAHSESYVGRTWKRPKGILKQREEEPEADLENQGWRKNRDSSDRENQSSLVTADVNVCSNKLLQLEVIAGPSAGIRLGQKQGGGVGVSVTVGRIAQNDLVLNDPEVSGKHVAITWNLKKEKDEQVSKWELVDMGSLNGTLVNGQQVADAVNSQPRHRSHPVALANGDVIALGSSQVLVQIGAGMKGSQLLVASAPFGVGVAVDAMTMRRGGKQLPMEDVCLCEWPLQGFQESSIGIFCVFDGHGGVAAAEAASRIMPQKLVEILAGEETWARVLRNGNASDVLRAAFHRTEEALDHEYEGCTATVLLLWPDANTGFYAQCANVGDSHCVIRMGPVTPAQHCSARIPDIESSCQVSSQAGPKASMGDQQVLMTEDHRLTSPSERLRLLQMGRQLKDGETRICGMNIARALGDKFLKEQDRAFSALPHISDVRRLTVESKAMVIIASDGLWDVLSPQRGVQLAAEAREGKSLEDGRKSTPQPAQGIAEYLLNKARNLRTKDNTSVIVLDFGSIRLPARGSLQPETPRVTFAGPTWLHPKGDDEC